jgi:PAS domain S-box-containing protein
MTKLRGVLHPKRLLKYAATALLLALLAYAAFLISQSRRDARSDQINRLATIADLTGTGIDTYFSQLEIGMQSLGEELADTLNKHDLKQAFHLVSRFQALHAELGNVILIRGDGQVLLTGKVANNRDMPTLANNSEFIKFRGELQKGPAFAIGHPVMGNIDKRWVVAARYAVAGRDGKPAYIISANLPVDLLQPYWPASQSPVITALGLVRDDGYLVSRYPEPDAARMDELYGKPAEGAMMAYLRANNFPQDGQVDMPGSDGKEADLRKLHRLQHFPVTLFVEIPVSEIRAAWWSRMHAFYLLLALMLAGILAVYGISLRRRHTWSMAQRREELRLNYEQALYERSPNEIFMFDTETLQISYANDYALENTGYTLAQLQNNNMLFLQPEMSIESFGAVIEPLRRGEQTTIKYQTVLKRANGSSYPVEVNLQLMTADDEGVAEGFMAIVNDITALKQAEENIRAFNAPVERRAARRK